jgi:hypothetical protein
MGNTSMGVEILTVFSQPSKKPEVRWRGILLTFAHALARESRLLEE